MTHLNQLQTLKIPCPECGQKQLKTIAWLTEHKSIACDCGHQATYNNIDALVMLAVTELK